MGYKIGILLSLTTLASPAYADHDQQVCAYSAFLLDTLDQVDEGELQTTFQEQYSAYQKLTEDQSELTREEAHLQKQILKDMRILASGGARSELQKVFSGLCKIGRVVGGASLRGAGLGGSVLTSGLTLPLRWMAKIGIGAVSRKSRSHDDPRGPSYLEFIGGKQAMGNWLSVAWQSFRVAFYSGNPWLLAVYGVASIDMQAESFCKQDGVKTPKADRFCRNFDRLKNGEYQVTETGRGLGVKLGQYLLHQIDFRSDESLNPRICEAPLRKQFRVARRAVERLKEKLAPLGLFDSKSPADILIIPPEAENGCVSLQVQNLTQTQSEFIASEGDLIIDGIAFSTQLKPLEVVPSATPLPTAVPTATPDFLKDEEICKSVWGAKIYKEATRKQDLEMKWNVVQMAISPGRFAEPVLENVVMNPKLLVQEPMNELASGKNVILIIAPSDQQISDYEEAQSKLEAWKGEFRTLDQKLTVLMKEKTYASCLIAQKETRFSYLRYVELKDLISEMQVAERIRELQLFKKEARKSRKLKLDWQILEMKSLNDIRKLLADPTLQNLILVSHGESNGKIVDAEFNELPHNAFASISPNLQSVHFFSCHSGDAVKSYRLKELLSSQSSFHQTRVVGHVHSASFLEEENSAPDLELGNFIERVDGELYRTLSQNIQNQVIRPGALAQMPELQECRIRFDGLAISKGAFHLKVNRHWALTEYPGEEKTQVTFPCDWLNESAASKSILITLENPNLLVKSTIQSPLVKVVIDGPDGRIASVLNEPPKPREDGSIGFMKWIIE